MVHQPGRAASPRNAAHRGECVLAGDTAPWRGAGLFLRGGAFASVAWSLLCVLFPLPGATALPGYRHWSTLGFGRHGRDRRLPVPAQDSAGNDATVALFGKSRCQRHALVDHRLGRQFPGVPSTSPIAARGHLCHGACLRH